MDKSRQSELVRWLKLQAAPARRWLRLSMLLGVLSGLLIIGQAWCLAVLLQSLIMEHVPREQLLTPFTVLVILFIARAVVAAIRERVGFICGQVVRRDIRRTVLDKLEQLGPVRVKGKPAGSWATIILEQIDDMQDYYSRYLPQMTLSATIPMMILITLFPINWAAALILL
ncbi:cysteine/glutathione ABC transporter permease/ATP-binding protein CydD, partial [Escherichia coli]|nr:cysteine/glutathione ABC transporter permease/ATP-binding protein CydD [Escherichia coli]